MQNEIRQKKVGRGRAGRKGEGGQWEVARLSTKSFARAGIEVAEVWAGVWNI